MQVSLTVNGTSVDADIPPNTLLIDFLRDRLRLKGTKLSCDVEVCGACTVLVDGLAASSCTYLAVDAADHEVTTIEGVAVDGELSTIQQAFVDHGAAQCGFCTPGMVMTAHAMAMDLAEPDPESIRHYLAGSICRCTGYVKILEAIEDALGASEAAGHEDATEGHRGATAVRAAPPA
jgi:carbon-monoxide dehydrogenase small subunit